jgi:hypothetical protein
MGFIYDSFSPVTEDEIAEFEDKHNLLLPTDYKEFLLQHNGGRPEPNMFPIRDFPYDTHGLMGWFYGIDDDFDLSLAENIETHTGRIPDDLIPIGHDPGGNLICLGVAGQAEGKVFFWYHGDEVEIRAEERPSYYNVYAVADSFTEFIESLSDSDELDL